MRKLHILKTLVDVFWFTSILAGIFLLFFIPYILISGEIIDIPIKIHDKTFIIDDFASKVFVIVNVIAFYIFVFGIYHFRKLLEQFRKRIIFEEENSFLLNQIGKCLLTASLISGISEFIFNLVKRSSLEVKLGTGFSSFLFAASIGLFFMVLSTVFKIARKAKLENDLTI